MEFNFEHSLFYFEIGLTITQWAHVEGTIFNIGDECSDTFRDDLYMDFLALKIFQNKLGWADGLVRAKHAGNVELIERWTKVHRQIDRCSLRRNKLAHWKAWNDPGRMPGKRTILVPWNGSGGELGVREIIAIRHAIANLFCVGTNFYNELRGDPFRMPTTLLKVPRVNDLVEGYKGIINVSN